MRRTARIRVTERFAGASASSVQPRPNPRPETEVRKTLMRWSRHSFCRMLPKGLTEGLQYPTLSAISVVL